MSITAINWARQQKTGTPLRQLVLYVLSDYADQWGFCWPGQEHLAALCQVSDRSIRTAVNELEEFGLLHKASIRSGKKSHNIYRVSVEPVDEPLPEAHFAQKVQDLAAILGPEVSSGRNGLDRKPTTVGPEELDSLDRKRASGNPLKNPPVNPNAPARAREEVAPAPALPGAIDPEKALRDRAHVAKQSYGRYRYSDAELQELINRGLLSVEQAIAAGGSPDRLKRIQEQGAET